MNKDIKELTKNPFKDNTNKEKHFKKLKSIFDKHGDGSIKSNIKLLDELETLLLKEEDPIVLHIYGSILFDNDFDAYSEMFFNKSKELGYNINESILVEDFEDIKKYLIGKYIQYDWAEYQKNTVEIKDVKQFSDGSFALEYDNGNFDVITKENLIELYQDGKTINDYVGFNLINHNINEAGTINLPKDIAEDLLPKIKQHVEIHNKFTVKDLEQLMLAGGADLKLIDETVSELVNMGFDFDIEQDDYTETNMFENILTVKFSDKDEFEKAKLFFDTKSDFTPDLINNEFMEFDFDADDQNDMDSLENYIDNELQKYFNTYSFISEKNINEHVNTKDKARNLRQQLKKEFPNIKFSITSDYLKITVAIMKAPINFLEGSNRVNTGYDQINHYVIDKYPLSEEAKSVLRRIKELLFDEQEEVVYDGDYGSVPNYYGRIEIGKWDRPFVYTGSDNINVNENKKYEVEVLDTEEVIFKYDTYSDQIKKDIINYLKENPTHELEYRINDDIVDHYKFNPKSGNVVKVITKGDKEYYKNINKNENMKNENTRSTTELEKNVFNYLDKLKKLNTGKHDLKIPVKYITNVFPNLTDKEAEELLSLWMKNYNEEGNYDEINESNDNIMLVDHIRIYWKGLSVKDGLIGEFYVTPRVHDQIEENFDNEISIDFIDEFVSVPASDVSGYNDVVNKMKETEFGKIYFREYNVNEHHLGEDVKPMADVQPEDVAYKLTDDITPYIVTTVYDQSIDAKRGFDNFEDLWNEFEDMNFGLSILAEDGANVIDLLNRISNVLLDTDLPEEINEENWNKYLSSLLDSFKNVSKNVTKETQHNFYKTFAPNILDILSDKKTSSFKYNDETDKENSLYVYEEGITESVNEGFERRIIVNDVGDELKNKINDFVIGHLWKGYITDEKAEEILGYIGDLAFDLVTKKIEFDGDAIESLAHELQLSTERLAQKLSAIINNNTHLFESLNEEFTTKDKIDYLAFHNNKSVREFENMSEEVIDKLYKELETKINESDNLNYVTVTYADGTEISTAMADHLTEEEMRNYFAIGKEFNIGSVEDNVQPVEKLIIHGIDDVNEEEDVLESIKENVNVNKSNFINPKKLVLPRPVYKQTMPYSEEQKPWNIYPESVEKPEKQEFDYNAVKNMVNEDTFLRFAYSNLMTGDFYEDMKKMYKEYIKDDEVNMNKLKTYESYTKYQINETLNKSKLANSILENLSVEITDDIKTNIYNNLNTITEIKNNVKSNIAISTPDFKNDIKVFNSLNIKNIVNEFKHSNIDLKTFDNDNILDFNKNAQMGLKTVLEHLNIFNTNNISVSSELSLVTALCILK